MNKSSTPEWLQNNGESSGATGSAVGDPFDGSTPNATTTDEESSGSRFACFSSGCVFLGLISLALSGLFVYAATVQANDADSLQWIIYYSFNAVLPAIFLVSYMCCFPVMAIYLLSAVTGIWSIVYIVIASLKVKDTPAGGAEDGTGDNENQTLLEEYIFELAGASIGLFSSLYHPSVAKCCVNKDDSKVEGETEGNILSEDV